MGLGALARRFDQRHSIECAVAPSSYLGGEALGALEDGVEVVVVADFIDAGGQQPRMGVSIDKEVSEAAASLHEGLDETLTVTRLCVKGALKRTLASTNPWESMIECVRRSSRNVKRWQSGEMCLRWTAAGMLEAQRQFRRVIGHADLAKLAHAVEREVTANYDRQTAVQAA